MSVEPSTQASTLSIPPEASSSHQLTWAACVMAALTLASRILGFARDLIIAAVYGTSTATQAFVVAFRIPNLLRDLVGEGAANTAFVPVLSRTRTLEGKASWAALAQGLFFRLVVGFSFLSAAGVIVAPILVAIVAPGFRPDPHLIGVTVKLTRILFPFIGLVGLAAFFMGVLNSANLFAAPAFGPAILNLCMIGGILFYRPDAVGLAWGIITGGILQLLFQWPSLSRAGVRLSLAPTFHPGIGQVGRLIVPRMLGTAVYQVSVLVDTIFASFREWVGSGGIAALYFAHRFLHLPLALFGISMAQAALPAMASAAASNDLPRVRSTCLLSLRNSLLIAIPSSIGLIVLGHPIISTLLERGAFSRSDTAMTVSALQWYAVGLGSLCGVKVLANTLYALHDTWTPVRSAIIAVAANAVLNWILVKPMGLGGLALATSLSSIWNTLHLYRAVCAKVGSMTQDLTLWLIKVLAASAGMAAMARALWAATGYLLVAIGAGAALFFGLALLFRVEEVRGIARWLFKKK